MKILVVGTGSVAKENYLPVLSAQEDVELLYFNMTESRATECADEFGGTVCSTIASAFDSAPDAVFVLTKETTRADALEALLPHTPQRVFLEKPLVAVGGQDHVTENDFDVARGLMYRLKTGGSETAMIFNYRFFEQTARAKAIVEDRSWGQVLTATASTNYACWSHVIDLMHYFSGPIERISALESRASRGGEMGNAPDTTALMAFASGASGTLLGSWSLDFSFPLFDICINYERGRLRMRGLDGELEIFDYSGNCRETYGIGRDTSRWDWYKASFKKSILAYLDSIRAGGPPPVPGEWGLRELQVEAAMRRSIKDQRPLVLDDEFALEEKEDA